MNRKLGSETDEPYMSLLVPPTSTIEISDFDIEKSLSQHPVISLSQSGIRRTQSQGSHSFSSSQAPIILNNDDKKSVRSQSSQLSSGLLAEQLPNKSSAAAVANKNNNSSLKRLIDSSDDDSDQGGALSYMNF